MKTINNLVDLLIYTIEDLYAAEMQMQKALPPIIEKAHHTSLKNALQHHLQLTEEQKDRLQKVLHLLNEKIQSGITAQFSKEHQSKGMSGLIEELNEVINSNLAADVTDAAIIASVQKMEHYEISTYGTALAFAKQIHLHKVETLLEETLNEEYDADDLLTSLATAALNKDALPVGLKIEEKTKETNEDDTNNRPAKVSISERDISSPGGRAGSSHRGYGSGESRGH